MVSKKKELVFNSISEIEKKYFPKYFQLVEARKVTDPKTMGIIIARSPLTKIKNLTIH